MPRWQLPKREKKCGRFIGGGGSMGMKPVGTLKKLRSNLLDILGLMKGAFKVRPEFFL